MTEASDIDGQPKEVSNCKIEKKRHTNLTVSSSVKRRTNDADDVGNASEVTESEVISKIFIFLFRQLDFILFYFQLHNVNEEIYCNNNRADLKKKQTLIYLMMIMCLLQLVDKENSGKKSNSLFEYIGLSSINYVIIDINFLDHK